MAAEFHRNSFTITWQIKNYKFLSEDDIFYNYSPWFTVDILEKTKFRLGVCPSLSSDKNCMRVCIEKVDNSVPLKKTILDYYLSLSSDQSTLSRFEKLISGHSGDYLYLNVPKAEVYEREAEKFLLPGILTFQCKIWKKQGFLSQDGECLLITKVIVKRMSFVGLVENFTDLKYGEKKDILIRSASVESSTFSMNIGLINESAIFTEIIPLNRKMIRVCNCVLYLLDSTGNEMKCGEGEFIYYHSKPNCDWMIPMQFSKRNPMELNKKYLAKDCLSLQCEITFSTGEYESKFVKTKYAANLSKGIEQPVSGMQNNNEVVREENRLMLTVQDDLMSLLASGIFSDTKLRTAAETFPAHKNILSARSSVFKAMFTNNMKEKISDCVEIEDLDADTVRRLLLFLYSDNLQDLDFESAKKLYFAGDKYEVLTLKNKCSRFLLGNLCISNCCDVLLLADRHSDIDLKKAAQEYIAQHDKEALQTDQWKHLEETNPLLTLETFRIMYQRNRRNS